MTEKINFEDTFKISEDIVSREIEGELIIIPLVAGIGDLEDDLYTLNDTGKEIWKTLDGKKDLKEISDILGRKFNSEPGVIRKDVLGLIAELQKRKMVIKV